MKTAMMSVPPLGEVATNTAAVESAVDAYATRVLETKSPPEAFIDTSLGPYVTALLRCAEIQDIEDVTTLTEFDSLVELLEDQCSMQREDAESALKSIAAAVCTGIVPGELNGAAGVKFGLYSGNLDSFQILGDSAEDSEIEGGKYGPIHSYIDPYTPTSAGGPSPLKPDNLIPFDLLGALNDPSPHFSRSGASKFNFAREQEPPQPESQPKEGNLDEAFPPLGASVVAQSKRGPRGKKNSKGPSDSKAQSDKELAAALFRPSRKNSIESDESPKLKPTLPPASDFASKNLYFQQQLDSAVEILLSMNQDLSEEAATAAAIMANTDFNIAQYIIDAALTAPPVCRHMLHDGCYRSDCQFSHDVEGHTCVFWLRGRCGKGSSCKFLHGFNDKLLDGIHVGEPSSSSFGSSSSGLKIEPLPGSNAGSAINSGISNHYSSLKPTAPVSGGSGATSGSLVGFDLSYGSNGPVSSLRQASPMELSGSNSVSSGDSKTGSSFANIASMGYSQDKFSSSSAADGNGNSSTAASATVRIPQDLWNAHENRDSSAFHIADPLERYRKVSSWVKRKDVIDLHYQSTKTFAVVLTTILPEKLAEFPEVWIVTGTGHHVGIKTHQKGGGALERAVVTWLTEIGYNFAKGRDRNGLGGAVLVRR